MFYFFERREQFLRCEIRPRDEGYDLIIRREDGTEHVEHYEDKAALDTRWIGLQQELTRDGWGGPHSRD